MCGIAGFFGQRRIDDSVWRAMHEAIGPRGPDARHAVLWHGDFTRTDDRPQSALLHTRLSIRDLRAVADQPMSNPTGDVWVCYNGEVYGWETERDKLRRQGTEFRTTGDTEFILAAYQTFGIDGLLPRLRGMFAIALLDLRKRRLYLVRDRMGIKPIVYYHHGSELAFGSTVRSVLPYVPAERRGLSPEGIDAYLAHRYVPAPGTVFGDIRRLPHGCYAEFDLESGALRLERYWQPTAETNHDLATIIGEAVELRTVSDRPLGLFLSGGIDSATVASVLKTTGHNDITAYTAAFPGTDFDEAPQAARIAQTLGMRHEILPIAPDISADFERIVADLDEPFADPSSIPLWYLASAASRRVRVVMGGDGGDELFAGYKRYASHLASQWRRGVRLWWRSTVPTRLPGRGAKLLDELAMSWEDAYSLRFSGMNPALRRFLQPDYSPVSAVHWWRVETHGRNGLEAMLSIDMENYLPEYILRKADLCTMAHGLELRVPLLDHRLYQTVIGLPHAQRFTTPAKLALSANCAVCSTLRLFEQKKRGFNPPLAPWLRGELLPRLSVLGESLETLTHGQLHATRTEALVNAFTRGDGSRAEQILQLLVLETSLRQLRALAH